MRLIRIGRDWISPEKVKSVSRNDRGDYLVSLIGRDAVVIDESNAPAFEAWLASVEHDPLAPRPNATPAKPVPALSGDDVDSPPELWLLMDECGWWIVPCDGEPDGVAVFACITERQAEAAALYRNAKFGTAFRPVRMVPAPTDGGETR